MLPSSAPVLPPAPVRIPPWLAAAARAARVARAAGALALVAAAAACGSTGEAATELARGGGARAAGATAGGETAAAVAAPAPRAAAPLAPPAVAPIPAGPEGAAIRRGRALLLATRDSLPAHVGNRLRCTSCHLDAGTRPDALPWLGVHARYPQYRSRSGRVIDLAERVNGCFERSMNGRRLPAEGRDMTDVLAYLAHLSRGVPVGSEMQGQGTPRVARLAPDTAAGARLYAARCASCHGDDGGGTAAAPPLWGAASYNIGAGMARLYTAAAFIRANMPHDRPGTLSEQEAVDVAAFVNAHPRPDFAAKADDWPHGGAPADVAYPTRAAGGR